MKKNYMAVSRLLLTGIFLITSLALKAGDPGDTTVVNTFNFNSNARSTRTATVLLQQLQVQMRQLQIPRVDDTLAVLATAAAGR